MRTREVVDGPNLPSAHHEPGVVRFGRPHRERTVSGQDDGRQREVPAVLGAGLAPAAVQQPVQPGDTGQPVRLEEKVELPAGVVGHGQGVQRWRHMSHCGVPGRVSIC